MVDRPNKPTAISPGPNTSSQQPQAEVTHDSSRVKATLPTGDSVEILLHGATILSWQSRGRENLWLSEKAVLDGSKAVRGGIPIVFPVFGPPPANHPTSSLPQHGLARNSRWEFLGKSTSESISSSDKDGNDDGGDESIKLDFGLYSSRIPAEARKAWPAADFSLVYTVTLGIDWLQTNVNVRNEGKESFVFQTLFHTYLRVQDISKTTVAGLLGVPYIDKVLDGAPNLESSDQLRINGEIDRIYKHIPQTITTVVEDGKPRFDVLRENFDDTVIWNPWSQKAAAMGDFFPKDGWKNMLCVEVGSVSSWQKLEAGDTYEAGQIIKSLH